MRANAGLVATGLVASALTACGGMGSSASGICDKALDRVVSATKTTVGEIRDHRVGPGTQPAKGAFGSLSDSHTAAWCSTPANGGSYTVYGVANGQAKAFGTIQGQGGVPTGAPQIP